LKKERKEGAFQLKKEQKDGAIGNPISRLIKEQFTIPAAAIDACKQ
jgi:hypothetical protein